MRILHCTCKLRPYIRQNVSNLQRNHFNIFLYGNTKELQCGYVHIFNIMLPFITWKKLLFKTDN